MNNKKLMIIDGNSLLHRAFHALPPLATTEGIYTNGVYGFITMLNKILDEYKPEYVCVAFDRKTPTFRHIEFDQYKAGRVKTPNELGMQFPILKEVLDKLNIYRIEVDGFEADDLAGTVAKFGEKHDLEVIAVSGDKDYLQLASDKTKVLITKKGITNLELYDDKAIIERYEMTPEQFIDLKGLMGDKSDNIPGVPGIGEKTGIKLLKEFESVEGIYDNIDLVQGKKLQEKLIENKQQAFMSKRLSRIVTNVPINLELQEMELREPKIEELYELYEKLEFKSLLNKLPKTTVDNDVNKDLERVKNNHKVITSKEEIEEVARNIEAAGKLYIRFAHNGEDPLKDDVLAVVIKSEDTECYYIDFMNNIKVLDDFVITFKEILENKGISKSGHNLKKDILTLFRYGVDMEGIHFDSMIGQYLINPAQTEYSIKNLSADYLGMEIDNKDDTLGTGKGKKSLTELTLEERTDFFCNELEAVCKLESHIKEIIESQDMNHLFYNVEIPLIEVLAHMEFTGFKVDKEKLLELGREFDEKIERLTKTIHGFAESEFNINSPKQLGEILFEKLDLPAIKKTKTGYSTNAEVLEKLHGKHAIISEIMAYRQIVKLKSTYVDGLLNLINKSTNKVHSSFNQTITTTGRISSTEPNLQNIPIKTEEGRQIRKVFVAEDKDYILVDADYSQIELRVLAHIANDPILKEAFFTGEDVHRKTASEVFGIPLEEVTPLMRSRAKAVNFGIVYGISDFGLSTGLSISRKEAKQYIDNYLEKYSKVKEYMDTAIKEGKSKGYVETILKRRRYLPELKSSNFNLRSFGERMAMNTPIQGSAADIIKVAMVNVFKELKERKMKSRLILQVHDELIVEAHISEVEEVKEILRNLMENAIKLDIPIKVDMETGDSWYDSK